jgi:hypothetical protein
MYFTRGVAKRIKVNHECVDEHRYWVSNTAGLMYQVWLKDLQISYAQFDRKTYVYFDKLITKFYVEFVINEAEYDLDLPFLLKKYPEICMIDEGAGKYLEKKARKADLRKLNWVYWNIFNVISSEPSRLLPLLSGRK